MSSTTHQIVVLGGNFGGFNITHYLFRQTLPVLQKLSPSTTYHVALITPNSHFYFKVGAPRALINPTLIPTDRIFKAIPEAFAQYDEAFTFVQGKAVDIDPESQTVTVQLTGDEQSGTKEVKYDSLFITTGTTSASPLWTLHDDHKSSIAALQQLNSVLPNAKTVLIAGAGPAGVETAGEIANAYPGAEITIVSASSVLPRQSALSTQAIQGLETLGINVLTDVKVISAPVTGESGVVKLATGEEKQVDVFIDARGAEKANTGFLPQNWLDDTGRILTRETYFRVKGDGKADVSGIYAIGDVVSGSANTAIELEAQFVTAASSFAVDVAAKLPHENASSGGIWGLLGYSNVPVQKEFKPMKDTVVVTIGPNGGVGQMMGWGLPAFVIRKAKALNFMLEMVGPAVSGEKFKKLN